MRVTTHITAVTAAAALLFCAFCETAAQTTQRFSRVVLDAGHGGKDPGAISKKNQEKEIVLDVVLRTGKLLADSLPEVEVVYTRDKDVFIPLKERAEIANKRKADLFVSVHANASLNKAAFGAETYVLGTHRTKDNMAVAQKENSVITLEDDYSNTYQGFDPNDTESYMIFSIMQNAYREQSIDMAALMQQGFKQAGRQDNSVKEAGFLVLREVSMPSVLIEIGYISNAEEEVYISSQKGRKEISERIYYAIKNYKHQFDIVNNVRINKQIGEIVPSVGSEAGLCYRIQVATCPENETRAISEDFGPVQCLKEDKKIKYFVGRCNHYEEAKKLLKLAKGVYDDAFIVPFLDGKKISTRQAKKIEKKK